MKKIYPSLTDLIKEELTDAEDEKTVKLIRKLKDVKKHGYLTKKEFVEIGMWKSPRPKKNYLRNSDKDVIGITKKVLSTKFEKRRITLLVTLKGVSIPTASAILTLIDPQNYGVIDIRVWQTLYLYGVVKNKPDGVNFSFNNWYTYLSKLRYFAKMYATSARNIERTIFLHHKKIQEGLLY
jgi:thermostable 8-oxoguanine DNA glycosylase